MSKGKNRTSNDDKTSKWWFADQDMVNQLITDAILDKPDGKTNLKLTMDFLRQGWAEVGVVVPNGNATDANKAMLAEYPPIKRWIELFSDWKVKVCKESEQPDLTAYVASANCCGIQTGCLVVADSQKFKFGAEFKGVAIFYKMMIGSSLES